MIDYLVNLVRATREQESVLIGASPRGSIFLLGAAKARASWPGAISSRPTISSPCSIRFSATA